MDELKYEKIGEANSRAEAEIIESFLKAEGIDVVLVEESISHSAYAVAAARVEIFVPKEKAKRALLDNFENLKWALGGLVNSYILVLYSEKVRL